MTQKIAWFQEQLKDKRFVRIVILAVIMACGLTVEFSIFSYGLLKIIRYLILYTVMFLIAWIDQNHKRIPNQLLLMLLAARGSLLVLEGLTVSQYWLAVLISAVSGALIGGGMFLLAHFISKGGIGMGDVKLLAVVGSYMGSGSIMAVVFLAVMACTVYSVIMLVLKKIKLKEEIPFAPFILIGTVLTMALGM